MGPLEIKMIIMIIMIEARLKAKVYFDHQVAFRYEFFTTSITLVNLKCEHADVFSGCLSQ